MVIADQSRDGENILFLSKINLPTEIYFFIRSLPSIRLPPLPPPWLGPFGLDVLPLILLAFLLIYLLLMHLLLMPCFSMFFSFTCDVAGPCLAAAAAAAFAAPWAKPFCCHMTHPVGRPTVGAQPSPLPLAGTGGSSSWKAMIL